MYMLKKIGSKIANKFDEWTTPSTPSQRRRKNPGISNNSNNNSNNNSYPDIFEWEREDDEQRQRHRETANMRTLAALNRERRYRQEWEENQRLQIQHQRRSEEVARERMKPQLIKSRSDRVVSNLC